MNRTAAQDDALVEVVKCARAAAGIGLDRGVLLDEIARSLLGVGDSVRLRRDRDLAGYEGVVVAMEEQPADGRSVHVELTGAARGIWRFRPEWLEKV